MSFYRVVWFLLSHILTRAWRLLRGRRTCGSGHGVCGVVLGRARARTRVAASAGEAKRCVGGRSWGVWVV